MNGSGPLEGVRVLDMSALGPGPFCGMYLAGHGASVIEVRRPGSIDARHDPSQAFSRGKRSIVVDLRSQLGPEIICRLVDHVDVLLESNRPGVLERRGLGPDNLLNRNPRLVYARLTGWGQTGPLASAAGHDINYIAGAGMLGAIAGPDSDRPVAPMNVVGDFASGSMMAAMGIVMALFERGRTGRGQVVDAAMVDGAAMLLTSQLEELNEGRWAGRGRSMLSGYAPFYSTYRCADGRWFAVGAIEPQFFANLLHVLEIDDFDLASQHDPASWEVLRRRLSERFASRPQGHWTTCFQGVDACANAVLELDELSTDPHLVERRTITDGRPGIIASPAPRFSAHANSSYGPRPSPGGNTASVLSDCGFSDAEIRDLFVSGVVE